MSFRKFKKEKNAFVGEKKRTFKKSKKNILTKGVNPRFWSKNGHFSKFFFFGKYRPGRCLLRYSRTNKNRLSRL